ncbi:MAG: class I SAM-dependent methyltransferase [Acidimicrobiales bacterium]|nr:class I SAM-dependent methyltransferase [Acidimicrobiales bacterium]
MSLPPPPGGSRWGDDPSVPRGASYDQHFDRLAAGGHDVHGEAALVASLAPGPRVLDAGCGTGRVAIELDRRGFDVVGTDLDPHMLGAARAKAPNLTWVEADLTGLDLDVGAFDAVVLAGNVLIFVAPGTEAAAVERCAAHLRPGGVLVAGFQIHSQRYGPADLDRDALAAGLELVDRWSTWDRAPFAAGGGYQVSVHRKR